MCTSFSNHWNLELCLECNFVTNMDISNRAWETPCLKCNVTKKWTVRAYVYLHFWLQISNVRACRRVHASSFSVERSLRYCNQMLLGCTTYSSSYPQHWGHHHTYRFANEQNSIDFVSKSLTFVNNCIKYQKVPAQEINIISHTFNSKWDTVQ